MEDEPLAQRAAKLEAAITKFAIEGLEPIMREGNVTVPIVGDEHGIKSGSDSAEWSGDYELTDEQISAAVTLGAAVEETAKALARWLAKQLEEEYDYHWTDEYVKETCEANEYVFDENGDPL